MDRNDHIIEKLQQINNNFNTKTNKYYTANTDTLESKLELLKKKIQLTISKNKEDVHQLIKDTNQLYDKVQSTNRHYQAEADNQMQKLRDIEDKFLRKVQLEILQRKQRESSILEAFEHKANLLRHQIQKQQKLRQSLFQQTTSTLQNDLPSILSQLSDQKDAFLHEEQQTAEQSGELMEESEKNLKQYIIEQQQNSNKIFELIRDLTKKIKVQIEEEKNMCEATHEQIFCYIEESCNKISDF